MQRTKVRRVLPGFGLSLGFTLAYLSLIVLIPLSAVFFKASSLGLVGFWAAATSPRVLASYRLSFGASLLAAAVNVVFMGSGRPFLFFFSSIVNGRTDCSYEKPVITPSEA